MLTPDARQAVHRTAARLPSMARERLCWAPWTGPTNGRRVSRVMSYPCTSPTRSAVPDDAQTLRCLALLRADRPGHAHTQSGARRPGRARSGRASGVADGFPAHDVLSRPGSYMPPVGPRGRHGWRSPGIGRDTAPAAGRPRTQGAAQRWRSRRRPAPGDRSPGRAATWADAGALSQIALAASAPSRPPPPRSFGSSRSRTASPNMFRQ